MKTIDSSTLGVLMANREPLDLIDIRSRTELAAMHIPGARSLPFAQLASPKFFQRPHPTDQSIYIISDDRGKASLATGILRAGGRANAIVVDGGMKMWVAQGFPVSRKWLSYLYHETSAAAAA